MTRDLLNRIATVFLGILATIGLAVVIQYLGETAFYVVCR